MYAHCACAVHSWVMLDRRRIKLIEGENETYQMDAHCACALHSWVMLERRIRPIEEGNESRKMYAHAQCIPG
jgi:hypothetical protein